MGVTGEDYTRFAQLGMTDPHTGDLGHELPSPGWHLPEKAWLAEDGGDSFLAWQGHGKKITAGPGLLLAFADLADAPDQAILKFARKWGVLRLCEHGLPYPGHVWLDPKPRKPLVRHHGATCENVLGGWPKAEWTDVWRAYARKALALLRLSADIRNGDAGSEDDWTAVDRVPVLDGPWVPHRGPDAIAWHVNRWLELGGATYRLTPRTTKPLEFAVEMDTPSMFSGIAGQLAPAIAADDAVGICAACGRSHWRAKRIAHGRRSFCSVCRDSGEAQRLSNREAARKRVKRGTQ